MSLTGPVPSVEKLVVALELLGPKDEKDSAAFREAVEALAKQYGASIIIRARAKK